MAQKKRKKGKKKSQNFKFSLFVIGSVVLIALLLSFMNGNSSLFQQEEVGESSTETVTQTEDGKLQVCCINVGQGDATLIMSDTKNVLIDGGERGQGKNVMAILEKYKIKKLDYVIATHPHSDHIGGIVDILYAMMKKDTSLKINRVITCDVADEVVPTSKTYEYFLSDIDELDINFTVLEKTKTLSLGNASMKIIPSPYTDDKNLNNESLVTIISHGKNDFVFTGDAEKAEEAALVGQDVFKGLGTVIYQAGHHGSETASTDILLDEIRPQYAVVSCGRDNSYGHPHKAAMNRLKKYTDRIFRTDEEGNILFVSDGRLCSYKTFR